MAYRAWVERGGATTSSAPENAPATVVDRDSEPSPSDKLAQLRAQREEKKAQEERVAAEKAAAEAKAEEERVAAEKAAEAKAEEERVAAEKQEGEETAENKDDE